MPKMPRMRLKEVTKKMNAREFRTVRDKEEMKVDSERKKEKQM